MATTPAITKHDLETNLIEKCWKDPDFKSKVLADPKGMFEKFLGKPLPSDVTIVIHQEDANTLHFAIPPAPAAVSELSDEDLERVAGGTEIGIVLGFATLIAATAGATASAVSVGVSIGVGGW